jgi:hypothetical protein
MTMDAKTDQMISLVLQINGYVKADDLLALPRDERVLALRSYYQAHEGDSPLHWRGEQLWAGDEAPDASFFAEAPAASVPEPESVEQAPVTPTPPSYGGSYGMPDAGGPDMFGDLAPAPQAAPAAVAVVDPMGAASPFSADPGAPSAPLAAGPLSAEPLVAEPTVYNPPVDSRL